MGLHKDLTNDDVHALPARTYADITARDADSDFNTNSDNVDKLVRVESPLSYYLLTSITPTWSESGNSSSNEWIELNDTPGSITADGHVKGNSGGTALEFGQGVDTTDSPTFDTLILTGDLTVNGATTTINSETLLVEDKNITIGNVATPTNVTADGGGITLLGTTDKTITWTNSTETWDFNHGVNIDGALSTTNDIDIGDINSLRFNDGELVMHHGGTSAFITNFTGDLVITNEDVTGAITVNLGTETNLTKFQVNDSAGNNLLKILGNGNIAFSNDDFVYVSGSLLRLDHLPINWGVNPVDLTMQHGGSNGFITNTTGDFTIKNEQTTGDIVSKIGSTSTTTNFIWQDSAGGELTRLTGAGDWGFDETDPDNKIHVNGGSIHIGAKNDVLDNRLILSSGGDIKMTRGFNDGSATSAHGRWQIINNVNAVLNASSDTGGIFFRQNAGQWGAVSGDAGALEFYTGGTSTNQTYDNLSSTLAMSIDDSQEVTMAADLALNADIIHQNIAASGSQSEIFLDDTGLVEQFRIRHDDSSFGKIFFTGRAQVTHESTNGVAWNWTMTNGDDTIPFFEWNQDGTNGADIQVHLTDRDPINITANSGSLAIRADGVDSALYVNHSAVNGNQWEALAFDSKLSRASFSTSTDTGTLGLVGLYACTDTSAARTLTISKTSIIQGSLTHAFEFIIKDESGGAGTNHITIETESTAVLFCEAGGGGTEFTTLSSHNLEVGSIVVHTGFSDSTYNGTFTVTSDVSGTTYGIAAITFNATSSGLLERTIDGLVSVQIIADYGDITLYTNGTNLLTVGI